MVNSDLLSVGWRYASVNHRFDLIMSIQQVYSTCKIASILLLLLTKILACFPDGFLYKILVKQ